MKGLIIGAAILVAGAIQAPEMNGLDVIGWAVIFFTAWNILRRARTR